MSQIVTNPILKEVIEVRKKISIGRTYNLGNYESLRLDVGLEDEASRSWLDVYQDCKVILEKMEEDQGVKVGVRKEKLKGY